MAEDGDLGLCRDFGEGGGRWVIRALGSAGSGLGRWV